MFQPIPGLDVFEFGVYWDRRRDEYPGRQVQPAVSEGVTFNLGGVHPMRAWLLSPQDDWVQQVQTDRFYMNWRKRDGGSEYPHFLGTGGVLARALQELERLAAFCESRDTISGNPSPKSIDLAKINVLTRGSDWSDLDDLSQLLPIVAPFVELGSSESLHINLQVQEAFAGGHMTVRINSVNGPDRKVSALRLENRVALELGSQDARQVFTRANERLDRMFFRLLPDAEKRFGRKER